MPLRQCRNPICSSLVKPPNRYCASHADQHRAERREIHRFYDQHKRGAILPALGMTAQQFYNSKQWETTRALVLLEHPICQRCEREFSQHVHHVRALRLCRSMSEALDPALLRGLCAGCHSAVEAAGGGEITPIAEAAPCKP